MDILFPYHAYLLLPSFPIMIAIAIATAIAAAAAAAAHRTNTHITKSHDSTTYRIISSRLLPLLPNRRKGGQSIGGKPPGQASSDVLRTHGRHHACAESVRVALWGERMRVDRNRGFVSRRLRVSVEVGHVAVLEARQSICNSVCLHKAGTDCALLKISGS